MNRYLQTLVWPARACCLAGAVTLLAALPALDVVAQDDAPRTPAVVPEQSPETPAAGAVIPPDPAEAAETQGGRVGIQELLARELEKTPPGQAYKDAAVLTIKGTDDGFIEVLDGQGKLLARYPRDYFSVVGQISPEAIARKEALTEAAQSEYAEKQAEQEVALEEAQEAAKEQAKRDQELAAEREAKWKEKFAEQAKTYQDRASGEEIQAVKIDARKIRKDGTYVVDGKTLTPVRLYNRARSRYEMAIPVESP